MYTLTTLIVVSGLALLTGLIVGLLWLPKRSDGKPWEKRPQCALKMTDDDEHIKARMRGEERL